MEAIATADTCCTSYHRSSEPQAPPRGPTLGVERRQARCVPSLQGHEMTMQFVCSAGLLFAAGLAGPAAAADAPRELAAGSPITDPTYDPPYSGFGREPDALGAFDSPTVLFVNFDGPFMNGGCGNDSRSDCSQLFANTQFEEFNGDAAKRAAVVQATRADVEDFGVVVVAQRPPEGNQYAMVVVGEPVGGAPTGVGGVAPGIDCGNNNPNITSFAFLSGASNTIATVIHQEAAHTWGLEHVDDESDNLYPTTGGVQDPKYQDTCSRVVADTQLNPTNSGCNAVHTLFCESNFQNSYQEMLALFGGPILDTVAPEVTIESPADGLELDYEDDFELIVTLDDDRRPQILQTRIFFDDSLVAEVELLDQQHSFPGNGGDPPTGHGLANGEHTIVVEAQDESGNVGEDSITIRIVNGPAADDESSGTAAPSETGDSDSASTGGAASGGADDESAEDDDAGTSETDSATSNTDGDAGCSCAAAGSDDRVRLAFSLLLLGLLRRRV